MMYHFLIRYGVERRPGIAGRVSRELRPNGRPAPWWRGCCSLVGWEVVPVDWSSVGILFPVERIPSRMLNRRHPGLCRLVAQQSQCPTAA